MMLPFVLGDIISFMRLIIIYIIIFSCLQLNAQKEDYAWLLDLNRDGDLPAEGLLYDWNIKDGGPVMLQMPFGINGNNASISDKDGHLLFWTNGCAVMNRNQEVMPHGDTLNWDTYREVIGSESCQRGYSGKQNIKILSDPNYDDGYYIFHKALRYFGQFEDVTIDLRYSYVDMALDDGKGDLVFFDSILYDSPVTNSNLEAIYHENGKDWWLLQPIEDDSIFLHYKISDTGIERFPDKNSSVNFTDKRNGAGTLRMSPDGTKLAYYDYFLNLHVYGFDRSTGELSNHKKVNIFDDVDEKPNSDFRFGGVEWSPNSRFMYVSIRDSLFQVDSWEDNMNDGIRLIDVYNGTQDPFSTNFYIGSLAPDCKIYICSTNGTASYHIIHRPDELGTACNFVQNGLKLPESTGAANLPLFPRFRVDEVEKCDSTITSIFGDDIFYRRDLNVYPNPSDGRFIVEIPDKFTKGLLVVFDIGGQLVRKVEVNSQIENLDVNITDLPSKQYLIELYPYENKDRVFWSNTVIKIK